MKKSTIFSLGILVAAFCLVSMDLSIGIQKGRGGSSSLVISKSVDAQASQDHFSAHDH